MAKEVVVTQQGLKALEDELEHLKIVRRKEVAEKIKVARGYGDLSENAEYDAAKDEQGEIEARIADLEVMLKHVRVLDSEELDTNSVTVGTTVALEDLDEEDEEDKFITYSISGATEANPDNNIISDESPVGSGLLGTSIAMLGDMTDSISLYLNRAGAGWPANTGIRTPTQVEPLAGGFVEMDNEDVAVYSAYGAKIRTIQPGYARPALAVGNTRFVLYNRAGKELTVQSRTRQLYAKSFNNAIMLCEMAQNGTLAVVTESDRYAAEVMVYDASFSGDPFTWKLTSTDGTPIALSFATDNHRFAAATVAARDGQLRTTVRMMNTNSDTAGPFYVADTGSVILKLKWISSSRVLAVFDTYAAIINVSDGTESARYDYGGATLQSVSIGGRSTALLLAVRGGDTLVTLDDSLNQLASVAAGQAKSVSSTATAVYLLTASGVESYGYDGTHNWSRDYGAAPQAVINARETLVFISGTVEVLNAPHE